MSTRKVSSTPPVIRPHGDIEELPEAELLAGLDDAVHDPDPLTLITLASGLIAALDPRARNPMEAGPEPALPTFAEFCETLLDVGFRQTDALLLLFAAMSRDELLRARIRRAVAERRHTIPGWLLRLDQVTPYRAIEMVHVLRDGDNVVVGVHLPGGHECSILVYIDHNLGTVVKDAFVLDEPLDQVIEMWRERDPGTDSEINELPDADARVRVADAIDLGAITYPPFETETWPLYRPFTEWIVSMLPDGGTGYTRPVWSDEQLAALTADFFASRFGAGLDDEDHRALLENILWFGTDYGPGDPLRWSPTSVEILLADWIPRKLVAPADYLAKAPDVLRAFVRYAHAERRIHAELTTDTLATINDVEADYLETIRAPRAQGPMALLERIEALDEADRDDANSSWTEGMDYEGHMLAVLAATVGGAEQLDALDTEPLPEEPVKLQDVPDDIHDKVREVSSLVDSCCDALFDAELRTAARRFLSEVATADPEIFRRRASSTTAAAAVCWVVAQANKQFDLYGAQGAGVRVKDMMSHFGLTGSVSQRADVMLRAIGADHAEVGTVTLGNPALLVSADRARVVELRDHFRATSD